MNRTKPDLGRLIGAPLIGSEEMTRSSKGHTKKGGIDKSTVQLYPNLGPEVRLHFSDHESSPSPDESQCVLAT